MPHLVEMDRRYSKKGLQVIGAHVQSATDEEIEEKIDDLKIKFPVTKGVSGPNLSNGIPHVAVFDVAGKLVFSGHPADGEFDKTVKRELKKASATEDESESSSVFGAREELVAERTWTNTDGNQLKASLVSVSGTTGTFRKPNGQTFTYDVSKLSPSDQEVIAKASGTGSDGG